MLLGLLSRVVAKGDLTVIAPNGRSHRFGDGTNPKSIIEISDWGTFLRLSLKPQLAIGEAYMDGRLIIREGGIAGLLEVLLLNLGTGTAGGLAGAVDGLRRFVRRLQQFNPMTRARRNVAHHYDLSGAMYDLFLDADRQYSCAYYETPGMTLEDAQAAKKRHIAAKLALKPGIRVLDIGCGWGGLALYLAELGAASVKGITLSQEQLAHARGRAQAARQSGRVAFALEDYRKTQGTFDRIVSVGMFEHVGIGHYGEYFTQIARLLSENGVGLIHTIGRSDGPGHTNPFIAKYIFPGGYTPALSEILPAIERAGLMVTDVETLRLHYAETLKEWRARFTAHWKEAAQLYDERFCRMWEFYLAGAEMGFRHQGLVVFQLQLAKRVDALPLTRNYIDAFERTNQLPVPEHGKRAA